MNDLGTCRSETFERGWLLHIMLSSPNNDKGTRETARRLLGQGRSVLGVDLVEREIWYINLELALLL